MRGNKKHVMIMGAQGYNRGYGGWETLVNNLISHWKKEDYQFYVSEIVYERKEETILEQDGVICPQVYAPHIGGATMVYFCIRAFYKAIRYVKEHELKNVIFLVIGLRIGPVVTLLRSKLIRMGIKVVINPDGFEWERAKWPWPVKKYFLLSEFTMFRVSDTIICDSHVVKDYVEHKYPAIKIPIYYISYGAETIADAPAAEESQVVEDKLREFYDRNGIKVKEYYLVVGRFVPENNLELILREFMKSATSKDLIIISNVEEKKFYHQLKESTGFQQDRRIKFVGTVYDRELLVRIRRDAYAYLHGHSAGGTNPSLLEALASTQLNLLYDVSFNREVGKDIAFYFGNQENPLHCLINQAEAFSEETIREKGEMAKRRIGQNYTWEIVVDGYEKVFRELLNEKYDRRSTYEISYEYCTHHSRESKSKRA